MKFRACWYDNSPTEHIANGYSTLSFGICGRSQVRSLFAVICATVTAFARRYPVSKVITSDNKVNYYFNCYVNIIRIIRERFQKDYNSIFGANVRTLDLKLDARNFDPRYNLFYQFTFARNVINTQTNGNNYDEKDNDGMEEGAKIKMSLDILAQLSIIDVSTSWKYMYDYFITWLQISTLGRLTGETNMQ